MKIFKFTYNNTPNTAYLANICRPQNTQGTMRNTLSDLNGSK